MRTHHGVLGDGEVRARDFGMPPPHPPPLREEEDPLDDPRRPEVPHGVHGEVNPRPDPKTGTGDRGREWRARAAANLHEVEGLDEDAPSVTPRRKLEVHTVAPDAALLKRLEGAAGEAGAMTAPSPASPEPLVHPRRGLGGAA